MEPRTLKLECSITEQEEKIFNLLLEVNNRYKAGCVLRVAGGWVRDKVLGDHSDDIDIAIEGGTGADFSSLIVRYQAEIGQETRSIGLIRVNPAQSKHLETATTHIFGTAIDLVNLRSEEYTESTRIPSVKHGTPLEDAKRRDFTINALFYNLHTKLVEDYTSGIPDLRNKIIKTPIDPSITFTDDPLRLLRCVRFAARYDCTVDEPILEAAKQPGILSTLNKKVSRGRIGIEIRKMMSSRHPSRAVSLLNEFNLLGIFQNSKVDKKGKVTEGEPLQFSKEQINCSISIMKYLENNYCHDDQQMPTELSLAALFTPYVGSIVSSYSLEKLLIGTISHGFQLPKKLVEHAHLIIQNSCAMSGLWSTLPLDLRSLEDKKTLYKKDNGEVKHSTRVCLCVGMHGAVEKNNKEITNVFWKECVSLSYAAREPFIDCKYTPDDVVMYVNNDAFLSSVPRVVPTVPADTIRLSLSLKGPAIKEGIDKTLVYQFEYPSSSTEDVMSYLKHIYKDVDVQVPKKKNKKTKHIVNTDIKRQKPV